MRIKQTIKNSLYAIVSYMLIVIISLFVRRTFVSFLDVSLLGYEGLFGNLFQLLALSDLGIETIVVYRLFPVIAIDDKQKISELMSIYRKLYRIVGGVILIIGIALIPILRYLIKDNELDWNYVYVIYIIQLGSLLCTYFLAYNRVLFKVDQKEYVCTRVDTSVSLIANVIKLLVLIIFRNYIVYLVVNLLANIFKNIIIKVKTKVFYPEIRYKKVKLSNIDSSDYFKDAKNNIVQKICGTIYGGTDNIITSALMGIDYVGLLSNYGVLIGYITDFISKVFSPFQASIGNYIYSDKKNDKSLFYLLDLFGFFLGSFVAVALFVTVDPFIECWLGVEYKLGILFVLFLSVNQYISWNNIFLNYFRYSFGKYEIDKPFIIAGTILNIFLSLFLLDKIGIAGLILGTAIGNMGFWIGRVKVVYQLYIQKSLREYWIQQFLRGLILVMELYIVGFLTRGFGARLIDVLYRGLLCIIICGMVDVIILRCSKHYSLFKSLLNKSVNVFKKK